MWCDNCLLLFPLRAGAVVLAIFMTVYQLVGGFLLLKFGPLLFFHPPDFVIYAGFAFSQSVFSLIGAMAIFNRSYYFTKRLLYLHPVLLFLEVVRGAFMSWEVKHGEYRFLRECQNKDSGKSLSRGTCDGLNGYNLPDLVIVGMVTDFILTICPALFYLFAVAIFSKHRTHMAPWVTLDHASNLIVS